MPTTPPATPYNGYSDQQVGQTSLMYPLEDPEKAFRNVLQDQGYNTYRANPFTQMLQRGARGLRQSYIMDRAQGQNTGNGNPQTAGNESTGADFRNYLTHALGGGRLFATLNQSAEQLPSMIQNVRSYQNDVASGKQDATTANPFMALLADEMASGNGQGTTNALSYLRAPTMGSDLGRSYTSMLGNILDSSQRTLAQDPNTYTPGTPRDIWSYIFGSAGSPF